MIIEITYEGNGMFKVWPVPSDFEAKGIIQRIRQDGSEDGGSPEESEEVEDLREANRRYEGQVSELEDRLERIKDICDE